MRHLFLNFTNITDSVLGGKWEARGGLYHPLEQEQSCCVFNEAQKQPQCTSQAKTVVGSSLTPRAALLVLPSGTVHPVVDHHEFTGSETWLSVAVIDVSG